MVLIGCFHPCGFCKTMIAVFPANLGVYDLRGDGEIRGGAVAAVLRFTAWDAGFFSQPSLVSGLEEAADRVGAFSHGYTYFGHPIAAAAANAVLDIFEKERLSDRARIVSSHFHK